VFNPNNPFGSGVFPGGQFGNGFGGAAQDIVHTNSNADNNLMDYKKAYEDHLKNKGNSAPISGAGPNSQIVAGNNLPPTASLFSAQSPTSSGSGSGSVVQLGGSKNIVTVENLKVNYDKLKKQNIPIPPECADEKCQFIKINFPKSKFSHDKDLKVKFFKHHPYTVAETVITKVKAFLIDAPTGTNINVIDKSNNSGATNRKNKKYKSVLSSKSGSLEFCPPQDGDYRLNVKIPPVSKKTTIYAWVRHPQHTGSC